MHRLLRFLETPLRLIDDPGRAINEDAFFIILWIVAIIWFIRGQRHLKKKRENPEDKTKNVN